MSGFCFEGRVEYGVRDLDTLAEHARRWREAGASHLSLITMHAGLEGVDAHINAISEASARAALTESRATSGMPTCGMPDTPDEPTPDARPDIALGTIAREWGRIGCTGFGGPPTHIAMLRRVAVEREAWLDEAEFEDAIAATNLLPGPASTQLMIYAAWRLRGLPGALVGGACFILPGLVVIIGLAALFLASNPPTWVKGAALGAGAAVAPVAVNAALGPHAGQLATGSARHGPVGCVGSSTPWWAASRPRRSAPSSCWCCSGAAWWRSRSPAGPDRPRPSTGSPSRPWPSSRRVGWARSPGWRSRWERCPSVAVSSSFR